MSQIPDPSMDLRLTFYCKDPGSEGDDDCPTFYRTNRDTWAVQGDLRTDQSTLSQLRGLKSGEGLVEIPDALIDLLLQKYLAERSPDAIHHKEAPE